MFANDNDSIIQRGIDEALACQDMLERAPVKPSLLVRVIARVVAAVEALRHRRSEREELEPPSLPISAFRR
jgi:hypothetical protein